MDASSAALADRLGLKSGEFTERGRGIAKVALSTDGTVPLGGRRGKLVLVTAITPTSHGEGKTLTSIALGMALARRGRLAIPCLRQPSLGPVFGVKGGATGGGRSTIEPSAVINLGFTGDLHAVADAQNLLASFVDNHLHHGSALGLDPDRIELPRAVDLDDRALREVRVGLGRANGPERPGRFVITAASEAAAIHQMAHGWRDLRERLGRMVVGWTKAGAPVRAEATGAAGAMAALMRPAMEPNLVATCEGTPALVHAGPFANLGPGCASIASVRLALARGDVAVVEGGFAAELGGEKFVDLVGPAGGFEPDLAVIVATIPGLRHHGGGSWEMPDAEAVGRGLANLDRHLAILRRLSLGAVVALNRFPGDTPEEIARVRDHLDPAGVPWASSTAFAEGSGGAIELAERVEAALAGASPARPILEPGMPVAEKLATLVRELYGGAGVATGEAAVADATRLGPLGLERSPVCVAKTPLSLSDDPKLFGAPVGFTVKLQRLHAFAGAGFVVPALGSILTMPGLPEHPAGELIGLGDDGRVTGLG